MNFKYEYGEIIVFTFDVKELTKLVDGKLILSNYRVHTYY